MDLSTELISVIVLQIFVMQVASLECYHDMYARNQTVSGQDDISMDDTNDAGSGDVELPEEKALEKKLKIRECGTMPRCTSCYKSTTVFSRYIKGEVRKEYTIVSRVCSKEKGVERKAACKKLGPPGDQGYTEVCYCFEDRCNASSKSIANTAVLSFGLLARIIHSYM